MSQKNSHRLILFSTYLFILVGTSILTGWFFNIPLFNHFQPPWVHIYKKPELSLTYLTMLSIVILGFFIIIATHIILYLKREKTKTETKLVLKEQSLQEVMILEAAKRETDKRFRCLVDSKIIGIIISTTSGLITEANDVFLNMVGYSRTDLPLRWDRMTPPEHLQIDEQVIHEIKTHGRATSWEKEYICKNGARVPVLLGLSVLDQKEGVCLCYVLDLTEQKKLEKIKDEFISMISHELRIPLTVIGMGVENLADGMVGSLTLEQLEIIKRVQRNAERLSLLINNLLDLSRLESGRIKMDTRPFDLNLLISHELEDFAIKEKERYIRVEKNIAPHLPMAMGDPDLISQVILNILSNAYRYAMGKITAQTSFAGETFHVTMTNDGPPIPSDEIKNIFSKFVQLDRTTRQEKYKGTGLGLAICKAVINHHGGKIWAENKTGEKGVEFHFTLPLKTGPG